MRRRAFILALLFAPAIVAAADAVDPVCHMTVQVGPNTPHVTYKGREVYFCSQRCRDAFLANPSKY